MHRLLFTLGAAMALGSQFAGAADVPNRPANQAVQPQQLRPMIAAAPALKSLTLDSGQFVKAPSNFTLTDDGSNKSCIVSLDWGDGSTAPQYAIAGFPAKLSHTYQAAGPYTAKVTGVKTCTGEAKTTVNMMGQTPSQPLAAASLTVVEILPASPMAGQASLITVKLTGNTLNCVVDWDYGDGTTLPGAHINGGALSDQRIKTYTAPGTYTIKLHGKQACAGDVQTVAHVTAPAAGQQTSGAVAWPGNGPKPITIQSVTLLTPPPYTAGQTVQWKISGVDGAACGFGLSQGNQTFTNQLVPANSPQAATSNVLEKTISSQIAKAGFAVFGAQPDPTAAVPCLGGAQTTVQVQ